MARKPKTQPSPEAAAIIPTPGLAAPDKASVAARRGGKPKAAAPLPTLFLTTKDGDPAADNVEAVTLKVPGRKGQSRKPKQAAGAKTAPLLQNGATEPQGQAPGRPEAEANLDLTGDDAPAAAVAFRAGTAADSNPVQPNRNLVSSASEAAQSVLEAEASVSAKPAARWDRTTDRVQFDWPAIEQAAAQDGPNQGTAKLLVAARAEGARSRWPF